MENPLDYNFIGTVTPAGIPALDENVLIVSVSLNINKHCREFITENPDGSSLSTDKIREQYNRFITSMMQLKNKAKLEIIKDKKIVSVQQVAVKPFDYFLNNNVNITAPEYENIKTELWNKLLLASKGESKNNNHIHNESRVKNSYHPTPDLLLEQGELDLISRFSTDNVMTKNELKASNDKITLFEKLKKLHEFGNHNRQIGLIESTQFVNRYKMIGNDRLSKLKGLDLEESEELLRTNPLQFYREAYVDESNHFVDIDEIVHSFAKIVDDPILSRLMGLTTDYELSFNKFEMPRDGEDFILTVNPNLPKVKFLNTPVKYFKKDVDGFMKHAYLIENKSAKFKYFENSILLNDGVVIETIDMVSKVMQISNSREKAKKGDTIDNSLKDSLTRGMLFTHTELNQIIAPVDIVKNTEPLEFIEDTNISEEHFVRGHRVSVNYKNEFYPLTTRSIEIKDSKQKKSVYSNGNVASCIHFDAPMGYIDNGEVKSTSSNVMFEYSGELLKLKSAFAKAHKPKKNDYASDSADNTHDDGISKCEARWKQVITYYTYPVRKPSPKDQAAYKCFYDIPKRFIQSGKAPQLRFNEGYEFMVNQEYINGWGLPLANNSKDNVQLTLEDLSKDQRLKSQRREFFPAESKKAPIIVHKRSVSEKIGDSITNKPALENLVVLSETAADTDQVFDERHILPPKIEIESAFWYGLLSDLDQKQSFEFKTRANCPFANQNELIKYVNELDGKGKSKGNTCAECGKKTYCGGTQLKEYYSQEQISPNFFFTDPTVAGFRIRFFWDKEYQNEISLKNSDLFHFGGRIGIKPTSYLLHAYGSAGETMLFNNSNKKRLDIALKKGISIFAQLTNNVDELGKKYLVEGGFWNQIPESPYSDDFKGISESKTDKFKLKREKLIEETNAPKLITFTHAVRQPLVKPEIIKLESTTDDHRLIEHINDWLKEEEYLQYEIGSNIIAGRIDKDGNPAIDSSLTVVNLTSHFERLDAFKKIGFIKDTLPTGGLELWMRKEEFIDDPDQHVLVVNSGANHLPDEPVVSFDSKENFFNLEHKIEFTNDILSQLKNIENIEDLDEINDAFRSLITKLHLEYNFKTTKFEEREYYLKNTSKFKGYFTNEEFIDDAKGKAIDKLEQYTLPKIKDVVTNPKLRFKVIVLNNSQPSKPQIAYAVTTIQERKSSSANKTVSTQQGNIVTIYLKRGRLGSGKDERVGIIVDAASLYNKLFKEYELISKVGRDIISDRYGNRSEYLQYGDIIIHKDSQYNEGYDNELGIYHFLPKFDVEKQLWKFEVVLNIKTKKGKNLHNPFINFSLVHFQPFSINYNDKTADSNLLELKKDCRISDIENSTWSYLLPERKVSILFNKPERKDNFGSLDATVYFHHESLHHFNSDKDNWKVRSNFIVTVQGSETGLTLDWHSVGSWEDTDETGVDPLTFGFDQPLLSKEILDNKENVARLKLKFSKWAFPGKKELSNKFSYFRIRLIEVEWFTDETWPEMIERYKTEFPELFAEGVTNDIFDNEDMRVRYVELIY